MSANPQGLAASAANAVEEKVSQEIGGPARRKVIVILASVLALQAADLGTTGAVAAQLRSAFQLNNSEIGFLTAVTLFVAAITTLPAGILADRITRTKLLAASIFLWSAAIVVVGASTSYTMLLLTRLVLGAVTATALPAIASLTGDFFPGRERARVYGYILGGELVGAGLGFLVSGNIAGFVTWRFAFWWLVLPGAVLTWALWKLLPEPARGGQSRIGFHDEEIRSADEARSGGSSASDEGTPGGQSTGQRAAQEKGVKPIPDLVLHHDPEKMGVWDAVRYVLSIRTNVVLIVASAFGYSFFEAARTLGLIFIRSHFGLGQSTATTLLLVLGIGALVGVVLSGRLSEWLAGRGMLNARVLVPAFAFLVCAGGFAAGIVSPSIWIAIPLFTLGAAGLAATNPPMDAARLDIVHSRLWGRAEGVRTVVRTTFEGAAPLVVGFLADYFSGGGYSRAGQGTTGNARLGQGLEYALLIALIPVVIAPVILLFARGRYPRDAVTAAESERETRSSRATRGSGGGTAPRSSQAA